MGNPKSKITYFSANDNGEAEVITVNLTAQSTAKIKQFDFFFDFVSIPKFRINFPSGPFNPSNNPRFEKQKKT